MVGVPSSLALHMEQVGDVVELDCRHGAGHVHRPNVVRAVVAHLDALDRRAGGDVQGRIVGSAGHPAHAGRAPLEVEPLDLVERRRRAERDTRAV